MRDEELGTSGKHRTLDELNGTTQSRKATCAANGGDLNVRDWKD